MKLKISTALIFFLISNTFIYSQSIFNFPEDEVFLNVTLKDKLCIVKSNNLLSISSFTKKKCEMIQNDFSDLVIRMQSSSSSKEVILAFFDENDERFTPGFQLNKKNYKLISLIYNKKEKLYKMEFLENELHYYYLIKTIQTIRVKI